MKHFDKLFPKAKIIIIGPSGSGKGTQADLLEKDFGWKHISMGEVFRKETTKQSEYGKKVDKFMKKGEWVSTGLVLEGLIPILSALGFEGFILDGFPRLPDQPELLDDLLKTNGKKIDLVVHLKIRPEIIMARRKKVWRQGKTFYKDKRKDETLLAIQARFDSYQKTIKPILEFYKKKGILTEVDGERPVEEIYREIVKVVKEKIFKKEL